MYYIVTNKNILVDAEEDLETLPATVPPGTIAFTAGYKAIWQKAIDGTWESLL